MPPLPDLRLLCKVPAARENRSGNAAYAFVEGDIHTVEQPADLCRGLPVIRQHLEQPGPVQMQNNPLLTAIGGDGL
ncbi:hypothetical protein D3C74_412850 [compost metagenome]